MRTFVPDRTCQSLLLMALASRFKNKTTYNKLQVLIINKDVRKSLARKNGNENPIWSWNDSVGFINGRIGKNKFNSLRTLLDPGVSSSVILGKHMQTLKN